MSGSLTGTLSPLSKIGKRMALEQTCKQTRLNGVERSVFMSESLLMACDSLFPLEQIIVFGTI